MSGRFFEYDVFLSHNANDGSHVLRDRLVDAGVRAWHDGYADMSDRLVQSKIGRALGESRYICVCVHDAFRDSEWVRVEYTTGLDIQKTFHIPRVVVARTGSIGQIPTDLANCPLYDLSSSGVEPLATFLLKENARPPKGIAEDALPVGERTRLAAARKLRSVTKSHSHFQLSEFEIALLLRERLDVVAKENPGPSFEHFVWNVLNALHGRSGAGYRFEGRTILWRANELKSIYLGIFERLASLEAHLRYIFAKHKALVHDDTFADAVADIAESPAHAARAHLMITKLHRIEAASLRDLAKTDSLASRSRLEHAARNLAYIDAARRGISRSEALRQRQSRPRPSWKFWQRR